MLTKHVGRFRVFYEAPVGPLGRSSLSAQDHAGVADHSFERHTDTKKTPYVFTLNPSQAAQLKREARISPARFQVYETYRGFNDAGPHWNIVLRFSEHEIEVPHKLLLSNRKAEQAEFEVQGWKPNPSIERACSSGLRPPHISNASH